MEVKSYLKDHILLFDGAMGTYYAQQYPDDTVKCEWANIQHPERVMAIHNAYLNAGARAIKTNTFGANTRMLECTSEEVHDIICAGWSLACEAAAPFQAAVFADIGPLPEDESEYTAILDCFLALGAQNFLFETFASDAPVHDLAAYIKKRCPEAFIMASFAVTPDGFTRQGLSAHALMSRVRADVHIDATGFNCVSGPHHLLALARETMPDFDGQNKFFSVMPNAGYPTIVDGRTVFDGSSVYFASRCGDLAAAGVKILGGCCGTEPEHIAQTARVLKGEAVGKVSMLRKPNAKPMRNPDGLRNRLAQKLRSGKRVIAVELDRRQMQIFKNLWRERGS